jgi:hypothetical protein
MAEAPARWKLYLAINPIATHLGAPGEGWPSRHDPLRKGMKLLVLGLPSSSRPLGTCWSPTSSLVDDSNLFSFSAGLWRDGHVVGSAMHACNIVTRQGRDCLGVHRMLTVDAYLFFVINLDLKRIGRRSPPPSGCDVLKRRGALHTVPTRVSSTKSILCMRVFRRRGRSPL